MTLDYTVMAVIIFTALMLAAFQHGMKKQIPLFWGVMQSQFPATMEAYAIGLLILVMALAVVNMREGGKS